MSIINWYMQLYYKYRDYPVSTINNKYKRNELRNIYSNIFSRLCLYFYIDTTDLDITKNQGVASVNQSMAGETSKSIFEKSSTSHSRFHTTNNKQSKRLRFNETASINASKVGVDLEVAEQLFASLGALDSQLQPAVDQDTQAKITKSSSMLRLIKNTANEILYSLIMKSGTINSEEAVSDTMCFECNSQRSESNFHKQDTQSAHSSNSNIESARDSGKQQKKLVLNVETVPTNNQQLNYYFLEFCSGVDVLHEYDGKSELNIKSQIKLEDRYPKQKTINTSLNIKLGNLLSKSNSQERKQELDSILLQILQNSLIFSNNYISKFQVKSPLSSDNINFSDSLNIILETWLELVIMVEKEHILYEIVQELVREEEIDECTNYFYEKVSSYLYFICLISTKDLLVSTVSKQNFLCFLPELLSGSRSLSDFRLNKSEKHIQIYDVSLDKYIYNGVAFASILEKWKHIGRMISELLLEDNKIFWAQTYMQCCRLQDQYLEQKVELAYSLVLLNQKLENAHKTSSVTLPQWKRKYYQKSIKAIIQKQIGYCPYSFTYESSSKLSTKTKINFHQDVNLRDQQNRRGGYCFYDTKSAETEGKVCQMRQWEKIVRASIDILQGYKFLLDTGLQLFEGTPELIIQFFLESYFNLKKIEVFVKFDFLSIVQKYCEKVKNSIIFNNMKNALNPVSQVAITELGLHKQYYKYISKHITATFRSKQVSMSKQAGLANGGAQTASFNLLGQRERLMENDRNEQQSNFSQLPSHSQNIQDGNLTVLQDEGVIFALGLIKNGRNKQLPSIESTISVTVIDDLNKYLQLVNECNYIFSVVQQFEHSLGGSLQELKNSPGKPFLLLTSQQLSHTLAACLAQGEPSKLVMQTQRKTSNQGKAIKMPSMNSAVVVKKKNSFFSRKDYIEAESHHHTFNLEKYSSQIKLHSSCLMLLIEVYCRYLQFYETLSRNLDCEFCCLDNEQTSQEALAGVSVKKQSSSRRKLNQNRRLAWSKLQKYTIKYQQMPKSGRNHSLQEFRSSLEHELSLNSLNNDTLLILMYISSLEVNHETFLLIYKQELISEQKLQKVRVIGKQYYYRMHDLFSAGQKCGSVLKEQGFERRRNIYLQHTLVVLVSLLQLLYERDEQTVDMAPYTKILITYFVSKAYGINQSAQQKLHLDEDLINIHKIILQFLDWNELDEHPPELSERELISRLLELRTLPESDQFASALSALISEELSILDKYENKEEQKVGYLQKKICYYMLREIYFDSYYDVGIFQIKSLQARKNFSMYETKMRLFFDEIIAKDEQQFIERKKEELRQRSSHLKGYLVDYQKQPSCLPELKECLIRIVCIFDKTLNLLTQNRQFQMKKRGSNSISLRKNRRKSDLIYIHYVSTEFIKPNNQKVKVFENESYYFFRAIEVYEEMLCKKVEDCEKKYSIYKELGFSVPKSVCITFTQSELQAIRKSRESILALWINSEYRKLHETKMQLSHQNYLSKIEKLYIDLDVRHKVFESFKDKILNYEMQKTKIYHQYMDYIRGLKLDVYSHVSGEDPLPYFKLINAIKFYRLNIKKRELEQKIDEEFGKNLGKWNQGIITDMQNYHMWALQQMKQWEGVNEGSSKRKKQLFDIFSIVSKQLKRQQNKTIYIEVKGKQTNLKANQKETMQQLSLKKLNNSEAIKRSVRLLKPSLK